MALIKKYESFLSRIFKKKNSVSELIEYFAPIVEEKKRQIVNIEDLFMFLGDKGYRLIIHICLLTSTGDIIHIARIVNSELNWNFVLLTDEKKKISRQCYEERGLYFQVDIDEPNGAFFSVHALNKLSDRIKKSMRIELLYSKEQRYKGWIGKFK